MPPILIQATVNGIKHFLKLNVKPVQNDRYTKFIANTYNDQNISTAAIHNKLKSIFKFLQWKSKEYENQFTVEDKVIITNNLYGQFFSLSPKACSYTQHMMQLYTESQLWSATLKTQFQLEGYQKYPKPSCAALPIPSNTNRSSEVLLMSLMYKNNLMNSSLYKLNKVPSPLCDRCKEEEETVDHTIFRCREVDEEFRAQALTCYREANNLMSTEDITVDYIDLLSSSRHERFLHACLNIVECNNMRNTIML